MKLRETREAYERLINKRYLEYDGDYYAEMLKKLFELVEENEELEQMLKDEKFEEFHEKMWEQGWNDYLTGQYTGSYYCSTYRAREMVLDHEELLKDTLSEHYFGEDIPLDKAYNWEWLDCMIRCYLLDGILEEFENIWQTEIEPLLRRA